MASQLRKHGGVRMRLRNLDSENSKLSPLPADVQPESEMHILEL